MPARNVEPTSKTRDTKRVSTWHRCDFQSGSSSSQFPLVALYLFTWYRYEMRSHTSGVIIIMWKGRGCSSDSVCCCFWYLFGVENSLKHALFSTSKGSKQKFPTSTPELFARRVNTLLLTALTSQEVRRLRATTSPRKRRRARTFHKVYDPFPTPWGNGVGRQHWRAWSTSHTLKSKHKLRSRIPIQI